LLLKKQNIIRQVTLKPTLQLRTCAAQNPGDAEAELLHAIADTLDCPIPPFLAV
jgi:hypothetical protein